MRMRAISEDAATIAVGSLAQQPRNPGPCSTGKAADTKERSSHRSARLLLQSTFVKDVARAVHVCDAQFRCKKSRESSCCPHWHFQ